MSDRRVFGMSGPGQQGTDNRLTGIDADARLYPLTPFGTQAAGITIELVLHAQGSVQRTLGVVLMSHRSTENGKDAITGGLDHVAAITANRLHHGFERRI